MHHDKKIKGLLCGCLLIAITASLIIIVDARAKEKSDTDMIRTYGLVMKFADSYAANMLQSNTIFKEGVPACRTQRPFFVNIEGG